MTRNGRLTPVQALTRSLESLWMSEAAITFGGAKNTIKTDEQMAAAIIACLPEGWALTHVGGHTHNVDCPCPDPSLP